MVGGFADSKTVSDSGVKNKRVFSRRDQEKAIKTCPRHHQIRNRKKKLLLKRLVIKWARENVIRIKEVAESDQAIKRKNRERA